MRKNILLAALGVTGLLSANNSILKKEEPKPQKKIEAKERFSPNKKDEKRRSETDDENSGRTCTLWYTVEAPCGVVYYLCGNNYWDYHDLHQTMDEINEIECN